MSIQYRRFTSLIRLIAAILVISFFMQDVAWAHPDRIIAPTAQSGKLSTPSFLQNPGSRQRVAAAMRLLKGYISQGSVSKDLFKKKAPETKRNKDNVITATDIGRRASALLQKFTQSMCVDRGIIKVVHKIIKLKNISERIRTARVKVFMYNSKEFIDSGEDYHLGEGDEYETFIATDLLDYLDEDKTTQAGDEYLLHEFLCPMFGHEEAIRLQYLYFGKANYPDLPENDLSIKKPRGLLTKKLRTWIDRYSNDPAHKAIVAYMASGDEIRTIEEGMRDISKGHKDILLNPNEKKALTRLRAKLENMRNTAESIAQDLNRYLRGGNGYYAAIAYMLARPGLSPLVLDALDRLGGDCAKVAEGIRQKLGATLSISEGGNGLIGDYVPTGPVKFEFDDHALKYAASFHARNIITEDKSIVTLHAERAPPEIFSGFKRTGIDAIDQKLGSFLSAYNKDAYIMKLNIYGIDGIGLPDLLAIAEPFSENAIALFHELAHAAIKAGTLSLNTIIENIEGGEAELDRYINEAGKKYRNDLDIRVHYALRLFQRQRWGPEDEYLSELIKFADELYQYRNAARYPYSGQRVNSFKFDELRQAFVPSQEKVSISTMRKDKNTISVYSASADGFIMIEDMKEDERVATYGIDTCIACAISAYTANGKSISGVGHLLAHNDDISLKDLDERMESFVNILPSDINKLKVAIYFNDGESRYNEARREKIKGLKKKLKERFPFVEIIEDVDKQAVFASILMSPARWGNFDIAGTMRSWRLWPSPRFIPATQAGEAEQYLTAAEEKTWFAKLRSLENALDEEKRPKERERLIADIKDTESYLVGKYIRLVNIVYFRLRCTYGWPSDCYNDGIASGMLGLAAAVSRTKSGRCFNPEYGRFISYAYKYISGNMLKGLKERSYFMRMTDSEKTALRWLIRRIRELYFRLERIPSLEDIVDDVQRQVEVYKKEIRELHLDNVISNHDVKRELRRMRRNDPDDARFNKMIKESAMFMLINRFDGNIVKAVLYLLPRRVTSEDAVSDFVKDIEELQDIPDEPLELVPETRDPGVARLYTDELSRPSIFLTEREREILFFRSNNWTCEDIGKLYDVTREAINYMEHTAVAKIRALDQEDIIIDMMAPENGNWPRRFRIFKDIPQKSRAQMLKEAEGKATIGERVKILRRGLGLSWSELAEKAGIRDFWYLWDIERNVRKKHLENAFLRMRAVLISEMGAKDGDLTRKLLVSPPENAGQIIEAAKRIPEVNKRVEYLRKELGWSQQSLHITSNVSWMSIYNFETGETKNIHKDSMEKFMIALGRECGIDEEVLDDFVAEMTSAAPLATASSPTAESALADYGRIAGDVVEMSPEDRAKLPPLDYGNGFAWGAGKIVRSEKFVVKGDIYSAIDAKLKELNISQGFICMTPNPAYIIKPQIRFFDTDRKINGKASPGFVNIETSDGKLNIKSLRGTIMRKNPSDNVGIPHMHILTEKDGIYYGGHFFSVDSSLDGEVEVEVWEVAGFDSRRVMDPETGVLHFRSNQDQCAAFGENSRIMFEVAPGFNFIDTLISRLKEKGVTRANLNIAIGTFRSMYLVPDGQTAPVEIKPESGMELLWAKGVIDISNEKEPVIKIRVGVFDKDHRYYTGEIRRSDSSNIIKDLVEGELVIEDAKNLKPSVSSQATAAPAGETRQNDAKVRHSERAVVQTQASEESLPTEGMQTVKKEFNEVEAVRSIHALCGSLLPLCQRLEREVAGMDDSKKTLTLVEAERLREIIKYMGRVKVEWSTEIFSQYADSDMTKNFDTCINHDILGFEFYNMRYAVNHIYKTIKRGDNYEVHLDSLWNNFLRYSKKFGRFAALDRYIKPEMRKIDFDSCVDDIELFAVMSSKPVKRVKYSVDIMNDPDIRYSFERNRWEMVPTEPRKEDSDLNIQISRLVNLRKAPVYSSFSPTSEFDFLNGRTLVLYADSILEQGTAVDLKCVLNPKTSILNQCSFIIYGKKPNSAETLKKIITDANKSVFVHIIDPSALAEKYQDASINTSNPDEAKELGYLIRYANTHGYRGEKLIGVIKGATAIDYKEESKKVAQGFHTPVVSFSAADGFYSFTEALKRLIAAKEKNSINPDDWFIELPPVKELTAEMVKAYEDYKRAIDIVINA